LCALDADEFISGDLRQAILEIPAPTVTMALVWAN
jgi:hypothetical protein